MRTKMTVITAFLLPMLISSAQDVRFGLELGNEYGFGAKCAIGSPALNIEAGAGAMPIVSYIQVRQIGSSMWPSNNKSYLNIYLAGAVGGKINIALNDPEKSNRFGLKLGATWNSMIKTGYGGGMEYATSRERNAVVFAAGVMVYPEAYDMLLEELEKKERIALVRDDTSSFLSSIMPFVSVTIYL